MALAFPPCPGPELQLLPLGSPAAATELWFQAEYVMWGNEDIIHQVKNPTAPRSKCKDRLPVPDANNSDGTIQLSPAYADLGGFGIISLPELPFVANNHLHLQYTLHLPSTTHCSPIPATGSIWRSWNSRTDREQANPLSAVYRVRKIQRGKGPATLEVIESRADIGPPYTKPPLSDRVVAQIPLAGEEDQTTIALRWTRIRADTDRCGIHRQVRGWPCDSNGHSIQHRLRLRSARLDHGGRQLDRQGALFDPVAETMGRPAFDGTADYNVPDDSQYGSEFRLVIDNPSLSAKTL